MPEVSPTVFALSRGGVSNPIETSFGWHFFWVRDVVAPHTKPFDEVRDMIHAEYAAELALDGLYQLANHFQDELAAGSTLEEAAFALGLPFVQFQAIDASGRTPDGTRLGNLPDPSGFIERAFTTPEGMESDLAETSEGDYYILRVDEVTPAAALGESLGRHIDGTLVFDELLDVARSGDPDIGAVPGAGRAPSGLPVEDLEARLFRLGVSNEDGLRG